MLYIYRYKNIRERRLNIIIRIYTYTQTHISVWEREYVCKNGKEGGGGVGGDLAKNVGIQKKRAALYVYVCVYVFYFI